MFRPINRAHLLLHPNSHLPTGDVFLPDSRVLFPFETIEQILAECTVEVEFEAGGDGGEELGRTGKALNVRLLGGPSDEGRQGFRYVWFSRKGYELRRRGMSQCDMARRRRRQTWFSLVMNSQSSTSWTLRMSGISNLISGLRGLSSYLYF